MSAFFQIM